MQPQKTKWAKVNVDQLDKVFSVMDKVHTTFGRGAIDQQERDLLLEVLKQEASEIIKPALEPAESPAPKPAPQAEPKPEPKVEEEPEEVPESKKSKKK